MPRIGGRPPGVSTKHLREHERQYVRTMFFEGGKSKEEIRSRTGFSPAQIRRAIIADTAAVAPRPGRPKKNMMLPPSQDPQDLGSVGGSWEKPIYFDSPAAFGEWLAYNYSARTELFVGFFKKHTGRGTLTWSNAVDEALCWGWIDGVKRRVDDDRTVQRFTPRAQNRSHWSRVNVDKMALLMAAGRVHEPGRAAFAKRTEANTAQMSFEREVPLGDNFIRRLMAAAPANFYLAQRTPAYRRQVFHWVMTAKRPETQERRFEEMLASSSQGEDVKHFRRG
ncbi:hypothetical protein LQW54_004550 [Pestalotiopsis sp. IQ-011]|nr:hypothetical protein KJ359_008343 [Pestalotiopsis sp. 9143b]